MPLFSNPQSPDPGAWEPEAGEGRLSKTVGASEAGVFTSDLSAQDSSGCSRPARCRSPSCSVPASITSPTRP